MGVLSTRGRRPWKGEAVLVTRRMLQRRPPALTGHLMDLETLPAVDLDTTLRCRPDLQWRLTRDDEQIHLEFHAKTIDLPAYVEDEIAFMTKADRFTGAEVPSDLDDEGRLFAHADSCGVDVLQRELRCGLGLQGLGRQGRELVEPDADEHLGQQGREALLQPDRAWMATGLPRQPGLQHPCDLLERLVLQQPGEQQVARLQQREVLLVLDVALRQQARGL